MMVDGNMRFLLSAKRVGHNYYISHYEAFPDVRPPPLPASAARAPVVTCLVSAQFFDKTKPGHYCAVLMCVLARLPLPFGPPAHHLARPPQEGPQRAAVPAVQPLLRAL